MTTTERHPALGARRIVAVSTAAALLLGVSGLQLQAQAAQVVAQDAGKDRAITQTTVVAAPVPAETGAPTAS